MSDLRFNTHLLFTALCLVLSAPSVLAQNSNETVEQRLDKIEHQLQSGSDKILIISGTIEIDARYVDAQNETTSDVTLSTAEFAIEASITEQVTANLLFLYEEDKIDPPELDQGYITLQLGDTPFSVKAGQFYLPFGSFESNLISDSLTLTLGETRESAIQLDYADEHFHGSIFIFNGTTKESRDDERIDSYGATVGFNHQSDRYSFGIDFGYISNIADSNTLQNAVSDSSSMNNIIAGSTVQVTFTMGSITLLSEYLGANENFDTTDFAFKGGAARPSSSSFELAYNFNIKDHEATFALSIQNSNEAEAMGLAAQRTAAVFSYGVTTNTAISFELKHEEDYTVVQGGGGEKGENTNTGTLQLAVNF